MLREKLPPRYAERMATAKRVGVAVFRSKDTGEFRYAITPVADYGYWLNSFVSEKAALAWCKKHDLTVQE